MWKCGLIFLLCLNSVKLNSLFNKSAFDTKSDEAVEEIIRFIRNATSYSDVISIQTPKKDVFKIYNDKFQKAEQNSVEFLQFIDGSVDNITYNRLGNV